MKTRCSRRWVWIYAGLILSLCFIVMPAYGELLSKSGSERGTTTLYLPPKLCSVRVDNKGAITGTCYRISVSHSDPGTFCSRVKEVSIWLYGTQRINHLIEPKREPNLCSFNTNDVWFDPIFPILNVPDQAMEIARRYSVACKATGQNGAKFLTKHPFGFEKVDLGLNYIDGFPPLESYASYKEIHTIPPIELTCDPCPQITMNDSMRLIPNTMVTIPSASIVTGAGIAPYTVTFSNLPDGLLSQGGNLTGRPAPGIYPGTVTVEDSCRSAVNRITKNFLFKVNEPPKILSFTNTPTTFDSSGGYNTVSVKASDDLGMAEVHLVVTNPDGTQTTVPRIPRISGTAMDGEWKHSWVIPGNTTSSPKVYGIQAKVYDTGGDLATSQPISVTVPVNPPPKILSFTNAPTTFAYSGGNITVSVKAFDDKGVAEVRLIVTNPDGTQTAVPRIPRVSGTDVNGEWRYSWVMPGNSTSSPKVYGIQSRVYDTRGSMTTSQTISVTVPVRSAGTTLLPSPMVLPKLP